MSSVRSSPSRPWKRMLIAYLRARGRATHHRVPAAAGAARVRPLVRCVRAPSLAPALACAHRASGAGRCRQTRTGPSADLIPNMHSHRFQRGSGHVAGLTKVPSPTKHTRTTGDERQQALAAHERYTHINCKAAESLTVGLCSARCQRPITSSLQRSAVACARTCCDDEHAPARVVAQHRLLDVVL